MVPRLLLQLADGEGGRGPAAARDRPPVGCGQTGRDTSLNRILVRHNTGAAASDDKLLEVAVGDGIVTHTRLGNRAELGNESRRAG